MTDHQETIRGLHVDDDPEFTDLTATMLEESYEQFQVETATSGREGIDRVSSETFDFVVSDYEMPGVDGIEFLKTVRESHPDLPFILFTGKGSESVASDAIAAGATDYLQKPAASNSTTCSQIASRTPSSNTGRNNAESASKGSARSSIR